MRRKALISLISAESVFRADNLLNLLFTTALYFYKENVVARNRVAPEALYVKKREGGTRNDHEAYKGSKGISG